MQLIIQISQISSQMQIEGQNNQIRQLKCFQLVQSNSQFMTVVRRLINQQSGKNLNLASHYIQKNTQIRIDYENFIQCFIQVAYLTYTGKYYGLNPQIQGKDVRIQEKIEQSFNWGAEKKFSIIIFYSFSDNTLEYFKIINDVYLYLFELQRKYETNVKGNQLDTEYKNILANFQQQFGIILQILNKIDNSQKQKQFFFLLEETDMFRQKSMLLKIKNSSILDYIKMKVSKFKQSKENDVRMVNQYINEKKKLKSDLEQLKKKQKLIQKNILEFFEAIQKSNKSRFKIKMQSDQNFKTKFILISYDQPEQPFLVRINKVNNSQENAMQEQIPKQKAPYTEYQIQYNSQRNSICVRLVLSSIAFSSQNPDYIMFQSNVLTFQSANISLQLVEDKVRGSGKHLGFRGCSCFNNKEPILEKILTLMDLTMIAAKIYEPEILSIRKNFMVDKDVQKLMTMYQKVNHYTKVFLRCAKKVYNQ